MFTQWIIDTLKEIEAKALRAQYQPNISALERVYGKEATERIQQTMEQARKLNAVP